ncbi:MAG TPA: glutathione S-transferase [Devosiaceae bacterium]|jgi:glutathione S-transferase
MAYELYYWTGIQGRGEFVRLALEDAGADYKDVARDKDDGVIGKLSGDARIATPSFAPPFLRDGDIIIGQTAVILGYLGPRHELVSQNAAERLWTHQIQLTIADMVAEAHDTHHPVGTGLYYEDQKPEARRNADQFRAGRMPKFLDWFETIIARNPHGGGQLAGPAVSYADLSLFQLVEALTYAFPRRMAALRGDYPLLMNLVERVRARPGIAAYLQSDRRLDFNTSGVFRHYPELDGPG